MRHAEAGRREGGLPPSQITTGLDAVLRSASDLQAFDQSASDGHLPASFVASERARLVKIVRDADADALAAAQKYADTEADDIARARAAVLSKRDPTSVVAEEMERARIVAGPSSGDDLARIAVCLACPRENGHGGGQEG
jgi:hypothetical protein